MKVTACYLFFLSVVTFELAGRNVCSVTTSPDLGEVPSTHKPHILSTPTVASVSEGHNVTFLCSVDDLGDFVIMWLKNGEVLFLGDHDSKKDPRIKLMANKSLHISNVHATDAAEYTCQISTFPKLELRHTLIVESAPIASTIPKNGSVTVELGDRLTFGCDSSGFSSPTITWTHSMKELTEYANEGTIVIPEAKKEHAGIYECKIHKGVDVLALGKVEVNVHYKPYVEVPTKLIYTGEGATAQISCAAYGEPPPTVTWLKDNTRILVTQDHSKSNSFYYRTIGNTHTLQIRKVTQNDLGIYTCNAINSLGSASETIEVTGVPAPVKFKYQINDNKPDSFSMSWTVKSHSPINEFKLKFRKRPENGEEEYTWTEVAIPAEKHPGLIQKHSYEITGLEPASVYEAVVLPRNKFGWNNRSEIFIFKTEGGVIGEEEIDTVIETNEPNENMIKTSEVTSSSIAESQTNNDNSGANSLFWTAQIVILLDIVVKFLW